MQFLNINLEFLLQFFKVGKKKVEKNPFLLRKRQRAQCYAFIEISKARTGNKRMQEEEDFFLAN
jgi:hypothetical protein